MVIVITTKCSLKCTHCLFSCEENGIHMEKEVLGNAIDFFNKSGSKFLQISGGEPTEHPKFFQFLMYILNNVDRKTEITLLSNGQFLHNNTFTKRLSEINKKYKFQIQISAIKNLYPNWEKTIALFHTKWKLFKNKIFYVDTITTIDNIGRAKDKDFSFLGNLYQRKAPSCFNLFNIAKIKDHIVGKGINGNKYYEFNTLESIMEFLDYNSTYNKCKPLIYYDGTIYPGECNLCITPGTVMDVSCKDFYEFLRSNSPCKKCGNFLI